MTDTWAQDFEAANVILEEYAPRNLRDDTTLVIQAFLDNLPPDGRHKLALHIHEAAEDDMKLRQLRNCLVDSLLKPLKVGGGTTPRSGSMSGPSDPEDIAEISEAADTMGPSTRAEQDALKRRCLERDGHRCVVTNAYDLKSVNDGRIVNPPGARLGNTQCSHIIPFHLRSFGSGRRERVNKATVWWALRQYFPASIEGLSSDTINQPANAMTLIGEVHEHFGAFMLAFVPVDDAPNQYTVELFGALAGGVPTFPIEERITFNTDALTPSPSPQYLDIHLRIARILQVSGVGRRINQALAAPEPYSVDPNGSTELGEVIARKLLIDI